MLGEQLAQLFERYPGLRLLTRDALYAERDLCRAIVGYGRDCLARIEGNRPEALAALADGFAWRNWVSLRRRPWEKSGCDREAAHLDRCGAGRLYPGGVGLSRSEAGGNGGEGDGGHSRRGGEPGALVSADQPEFPAVRTRRCGPKELLRGFRNRWRVENSLHHVKDRSWDEDVHTLRRPGLGEVFATLVNTGLNALRLEGWFPPRMSMPLRAKTCAFRPTQTIARLCGQPS